LNTARRARSHRASAARGASLLKTRRLLFEIFEERRMLSLSIGPLAAKAIVEGASYADAAAIVDTAATGTTTYTASVNYGDGTVDNNPELLNVNGDELLVLDHVYGSEGTYNVSASVQDSLGNSGTSNTAAITVNESPIALAAITTQTATEAAALNLTESFTDPGWGASYVASVDWGDGSGAQPVTPTNVLEGSAHTPTTGDLTLAHTYAWTVDGQAVGTDPTQSFTATGMVASTTDHPVTLTVTDAAGDVSAPASTTLHVHPLTAPVANAGGPYTDVEGQTVTLDGSGSSIPVSDTMGITDYKWIDADDGTTLGHGKTLPVSVTQTEDILLTVTDNDGLTDSTSSMINVVAKASTTTTLTASDPNPLLGEMETFTATVAASSAGAPVPTGSVTFSDGSTALGPAVTLVNGTAAIDVSTVAASSAGAPVPTGTVTFADGTTTIGTAQLDGNGAASIDVSTLAAGSHSITATYGGDSQNGEGVSSAIAIVVSQVSTTTTITASETSVVVGDTVTFSAAVAPTISGAATPTGTVTFYDGTVSLGIATLDSNGNASADVSTLSAGSHSITATYSGDALNSASSSSVVAVVVSQASTTTTISAPATMTDGQMTTITATVVASSANAPAPGGLVDFTENNDVFATGTLDATGTASIQVSSLTNVGDNVIAAHYAGSANYAPGWSATALVTANLGPCVVSNGGDVNSNDGSYFMSNTVGLTDPNPGANHWYVTYDYGDGSRDSATYDILGMYVLQHQYASAGDYQVTVNITDNMGWETSGSGTFNAYLS
jgi:hypothetical protein